MDVLFSLVLPEIFERMFSEGRNDLLEILPEFPLHKGLVLNENDESYNRSVKVDFAVFYKDPNRIFLVELKTDNHSINDAQLKNLKAAAAIEPTTLLKGVIKCARHSDSPRKYAHLIYYLNELGCFENFHHVKRMNLDQEGCRLRDKFEKIQISQDWTNADIQFKIIYPGGASKIAETARKIELVKALPEETRASFCDVIRALGEHPLANFLQTLSEFEPGRETPWSLESK